MFLTGPESVHAETVEPESTVTGSVNSFIGPESVLVKAVEPACTVTGSVVSLTGGAVLIPTVPANAQCIETASC